MTRGFGVSQRSEFATHFLNEEGIECAKEIARVFSFTLDRIEAICGTDGREMAIVRTKMEEAGFFAKKAMAVRPVFLRDEQRNLCEVWQKRRL